MMRLKKWYSDLVSADGRTAGYLYIMAVRLAGIPFGNVALHLVRDDGAEYRRTKTYPIGPSAWGDDPEIGDSSIVRHADRTSLSIAINDLILNLDYAGTAAPWSSSSGGTLLDDPRCSIRWKVLQPMADVTGTLTTGAGTVLINGTGYRDLVTMDTNPRAFPAKTLLWGRAHCEEYSFVFNRMELLDGRFLGALLVQQSGDIVEETGEILEIDAGAMGAARVSGKNCVLDLESPRVLERAPVFTSERLRPAFVRNGLRRISRDPMELKLLSRASVTINGKTRPGWAIHELVTWNSREG
jgi:hypothetical protein